MDHGISRNTIGALPREVANRYGNLRRNCLLIVQMGSGKLQILPDRGGGRGSPLHVYCAEAQSASSILLSSQQFHQSAAEVVLASLALILDQT